MSGLESQNPRDARVERLWRQLDTQGKGELDLNGLKKGLTKIDHPLKNATDLLKDVIKTVDTSGDGKIQYEEFRVFVERTEQELFSLFQSIDRDHNGNLDRDELQAAFKRASLAVPNSKLDKFFEEVDTDNDGVISFDEWRNFLLFLPSDSPGLRAVLSYYSSTVTLNAEGNTQLHDVEGLGRNPSFLTSLFGSLVAIVPQSTSRTRSSRAGESIETLGTAQGTLEAGRNKADGTPQLFATNQEQIVEVDRQVQIAHQSQSTDNSTPNVRDDDVELQDEEDEHSENRSLYRIVVKGLLTVSPDPGYFAAGGLAGVVSRTATAPLDRLKVYLIAHTGVTKESVEAVKKGDPMAAARHAGRPLIEASRELWRAGGIRSLFAGNGLNVIKVMPESGIKFGSYEAAKRALSHLEGHGDPQHINPYSKFVAGGIGGMISQLFVYPVDTLKFRMQCETVANGPHGNQLILATARKMIAEGAIKSSYRGLTMGLLGMFPYSAIDLGTFEFLKSKLAKRNAKALGCHEEDALPGSFATGCIGAFSGAFGASVVYPLNLLRTRLQTQGTILHPPTYTGIVDVTRKTIEREGVRGLFKGITPNLLKVVPSVSITYVVYENAKKAMHLR